MHLLGPLDIAVGAPGFKTSIFRSHALVAEIILEQGKMCGYFPVKIFFRQ